MFESESYVSLRMTGRVAALAAAACLSVPMSYAQQVVKPGEAPLLALSSAPALDLSRVEGVGYRGAGDGLAESSSSSAGAGTLDFNALAFGKEAAQPPPRRRYGRPRYNDNSHNADGSNKYAFIAGAGLTIPTGNTHKYLNTDYAFQVGAGRNFNKNFSLIAQFDWDAFGFQGSTLAAQSNLYFGTTNGYGLDGKSHIWSVSVNPVYNLYSSEGLGAYVVGGVGFYHKTANFTVPATGTYCDYYYGCYQYQANQTIDKYTSNAPGFNGGFGLTYKPSRFAGERLYVEARYVYMANQQRTYAQPNNFYPANSNRSTYIPVKAGIRF